LEPTMIQGFTPTGITGAHADYVAQGAAGRGDRALPVENGAVEAIEPPGTERSIQEISLDGGSNGAVFQIATGWTVQKAEGNVQVGRDLLWTGDFEDRLVGRNTLPAAPLWNFYGYDKRVSQRSAYAGRAGARLQRNSGSELEAVLTPMHRFLLSSAKEYTILGKYRTSIQPGGGPESLPTVQISWYGDTKGASGTRDQERLALSDSWTSFQWGLSRPPQAVAAGLYFRLGRGAFGQSWVDLDNVKVVEWYGPPDGRSRDSDHVLVRGEARLRMSKRVLPGSVEQSQPPLTPVP
ncbi:MAG TPA: hypothetical protein VGE01_12420, partial [Fimbriimonas sp.]